MIQLINKDQYKRSVWKNGLGFTEEIAINPPDSSLIQGNFLWRLSSARIEKSSPFSVFPNHDRILIILKGAGVRLTHVFEENGDEDTVDVPIHEPYEFPGDITSRCELLNGAITDFSIFLKKGEVEPMVEIMDLPANETLPWEAPGKWNFAYVISGRLQTPAGILNEASTLFNDEGTCELQALENDSKLLLISLG